jgi:two-component sensor histidine kinase
MKIKGLIVLTSVVAIMLGSCAKTSVTSAKIKTKEDSLSRVTALSLIQELLLRQCSTVKMANRKCQMK